MEQVDLTKSVSSSSLSFVAKVMNSGSFLVKYSGSARLSSFLTNSGKTSFILWSHSNRAASAFCYLVVALVTVAI